MCPKLRGLPLQNKKLSISKGIKLESGSIAQSGERWTCISKVTGSAPGTVQNLLPPYEVKVGFWASIYLKGLTFDLCLALA